MKVNPNRSANTNKIYRQNLRVNLSDWVNRPLNAISRRDVEARFHRITERHGWAGANQTMKMLRSLYRRPCVDHDGLRNPVDLWLAAGGKYHPQKRRRISSPAEVLPRWCAGIESVNHARAGQGRLLDRGLHRDASGGSEVAPVGARGSRAANPAG